MTWGDGDTMSIMIATDNHLGYAEKDALRANDSFDTFEEILRLSRQHNVDALLLGGDVFHENRPSRRTLHRTLEMLRHYCLGARPCALELLSDPAVNFPTKFGTVNYEDPNYNVALPVFAIHGNHDDPTGEGNLSSIDLLSTAGLVNYFGKTASVDDITMTPVLLRKGRTRLALFGLGAVRDERLHRTFLQRRVRMLRPPAAEDYFNMLILHQNRAAHGPTSYIPPHFLDDFLDLVVWGHEHECQACEPTACPERGFEILQPGSSVATSLSEGETKGKHVVILQIRGREMRMLPLPLASVRPFLMRDVVLRDVRPPLAVHDTRAISGFLVGQVDEMVDAARREWAAKQLALPAGVRQEDAACPLPLIRLRVDYAADADAEGFATAYAIMNPQRFGQQFVNRIANPRDAVSFLRRRATAAAARERTLSAGPPDGGMETTVRVEDLVSRFLTTQKLDLFPQNEFSDTVRVAVAKDDREAIESFVKQSIARTLSTVRDTKLERDEIKEELERSRRLREDEWTRMHPGAEEYHLAAMRQSVGDAALPSDADETDAADSEEKEEGVGMMVDERGAAKVGGRGGRGGRGGGGAARGRAGAVRARTATVVRSRAMPSKSTHALSEQVYTPSEPPVSVPTRRGRPQSQSRPPAKQPRLLLEPINLLGDEEENITPAENNNTHRTYRH